MTEYAASPARPDRRQPEWGANLVAVATLANGLLSIVSILAVRFSETPELFSMPLPFGLYHWSRSLALLFGFALTYLSFHLFQRQRVAWWLALVGALVSALVHFGRGHVWYTAAAPLLLGGLLLVFHSRFTVRSEPRSVVEGLALMVGSVLLALVYGTIGFWLLDKKDLGLEFGVTDSLLRTFRELTWIGNGDLIAQSRHAHWFLESLRLVGLTALVMALYSFFRPVAYRMRTLPQQRAQVKRILEQYGGTALDFFKLWPDKSYFFSPDQQVCIAFKTVWGVAVGLGDPVGSRDEIEATLRAYLRTCGDNGWDVTFHQVSPDLAPVYLRVGLETIKIGEEAVVDLARFTHETVNHKHMRHIRNKFDKDGYTLSRHLPPHDPAMMDQIEAVSREWLSLPGHHERTFTLGYFDRGYINDTPVVTVSEPGGTIIAFVNEIPSYRPGEATIDLMRHRLDVPNGTMDYLFIRLMELLYAEGFKYFNLGLAPFAGVGLEPDASLQERAAHQLAEILGRFASYKGIRSYKDKFEPVWEERFLVYQGGPLGLIKATAALTRASER